MFIAASSLRSATQDVDGQDKPGHHPNMQVQSSR
jgi:hypothetical protein